jgi:outer membrane lipoprotein-sorting protein
MHKIKFILALVLIAIVLSGCAKKISKAELENIQKKESVCSVFWLWYTGSDEKYHYFKTELPLKSKWFKVAKSK